MKPIFEISLLLKIFLIHLFFPFITKPRRLFLSLLSQIPSVFKKKRPYSDERVGARSLKLTCVNLITLCRYIIVSHEMVFRPISYHFRWFVAYPPFPSLGLGDFSEKWVKKEELPGMGSSSSFG
jgi:hypothetical protein